MQERETNKVKRYIEELITGIATEEEELEAQNRLDEKAKTIQEEIIESTNQENK